MDISPIYSDHTAPVLVILNFAKPAGPTYTYKYIQQNANVCTRHLYQIEHKLLHTGLMDQ